MEKTWQDLAKQPGETFLIVIMKTFDKMKFLYYTFSSYEIKMISICLDNHFPNIYPFSLSKIPNPN